MTESPVNIWNIIKEKEIFSYNIWFRILGILLYTDFYLSISQSFLGYAINKYTDILSLPFILWYSAGIILIIFLTSLLALSFYTLYAQIYINRRSPRKISELEFTATRINEYAMKNNNAIVAEKVREYERNKSENFINTLTKIGVIIFFCFDMFWKNTCVYKTTGENMSFQIGIVIVVCVPTICFLAQSLCIKEIDDTTMSIYSKKLRESIEKDL